MTIGNGEAGAGVESVDVYKGCTKECSGDEAPKDQGFNWSLPKSLRNARRETRGKGKGKGNLDRVTVESIGQWHGDRRVNESVARVGATGWQGGCAWVSSSLEVSDAAVQARSGPAPCQCEENR